MKEIMKKNMANLKNMYNSIRLEQKENKMKKILFILFVLLVFASCNTSSRVKNSALPSKCQTLEFWNGGTCIGKYEKVNVEYEMIKTTSITNSIYFYVYHVYNKDVDEYIVDSEALAMKFTILNFDVEY